jgi:hypothetical protein
VQATYLQTRINTTAPFRSAVAKPAIKKAKKNVNNKDRQILHT